MKTLTPCLLFLVATSAAAAGLEGRWTGHAAIPGRDMPLVIDLARDASGNWSGSLIVPGYEVKGAPLQNVVVQGDEARFDAGDALGAAPFGPTTFVARVASDGKLRGEISQAGNFAPLSLARTGDAQVEAPRRSTPVAAGTEGRWIGEFDLNGFPRKVTIDIANQGSAAPQVEFVVVGRATTRLPIDYISEEEGLLRIESRTYRIVFEGRIHGSRIDGVVEVGPQEIPLNLRRPEKS